MAEQTSHDVVNQTLSGGEPSLSDVPASISDKKPAGGDEGEINTTATTQADPESKIQLETEEIDASELQLGNTRKKKDTEHTFSDTSKHGPGSVATRVLEMNGVTSLSDGGEDTASQGGSESDASRTESRLHSRASSAKRPTTFKPVSFAKFSVPKAPGTPPATKPSEKAPLPSSISLGTSLQNSRPRLVAKTTSSLRDSLSKGGIGGTKLGGGGPDPNQVWNKNRPVQQTPPKHLTDEELKQQYGIHMTSRIQEDGGGTEAKWADIDDDEDDWAPETIEWTDGTKTNLAHPEPAPIAIQLATTATSSSSGLATATTATTTATTNKAITEAKEGFPPVEQVVTTKEPPKYIAKPVTSIGPNPTVLRLGASAERQARSATISSKGSNEKPTSSSTSPAPPPTKSPWAPIPPVERVSPVIPPVQLHPPPRISGREHGAPDGLSGPTAPKEIAADDFNRSWRETQPGTRELYNSRSGRYEPVPEPRKGTWRNEQAFRTPAVLQRPPAHGEHVGPAEPSPAFQTHRSSGQDGMHWTRRRTSSNVSGGSGSFGRRMSIGRPDTTQRSFDGRRGSQTNGMVEHPAPAREYPPKDMHFRETSPSRHGPGPSWPRRGSVNATERANHRPSGADQPSADSPVTDEQSIASQPIQEDPVVMQERIMKEKRLEARQRRLEQEEKEEAAKRERIKQKLEALGPPPDKPKPKSKESLESSKVETSAAAAPAQSPPKPPVPEPTGAPKQYGMMKVHHPDTVKKLVERERAQDRPNLAANIRRVSSPTREAKPDASVPNGFQQPSEHPTQVGDNVPDHALDEQGSQWRGNLNVPNTYSPWTSNSKLVSTSASITNLWKPLSHDKTLGNGIFDQTLGNFSSRDMALRNHLGLEQPSIPPNSQPFPASSRPPQENAAISPLPSPEVRQASYDALSPIGRPGPIGPPRSQHSHWQHEARTAAWNDFHAVAAKRDADEHEKVRNETNAREGQASLQVAFNETWRQVRTGDQAGQRQVVSISRSTDSNPAIPNTLSSLDPSVGTLPFTEAHARPLSSVPTRSSRFFPQATENRKPAFEDADYIRWPSPPPPEEVSTHPVYTGDSNRPLVHLPAPKPIVKLPPKVVAPPPPPPTFASMVASSPRAGPQPVSTAASWQEKINTLFGKKTITEKKNALAVSSASKEPLEVQLHIAAVSVSLPYNGDAQIGDGEMTARQVEEVEEMFEDREAGSLPVVRVPTMAPVAAWQAAPAPSQSRLRSKHLKSMQVHSIEPFTFGPYDKEVSGISRISIRLPGAVLAKTLTLSKKPGSHTSSRPRGPPTYKPRKSTKPREREGSGGSSFKKPSSSQQTNGSSSPRRQSRNASWGPRP